MPAVAGVTNSFVVLLAPSDTNIVSKTGTKDDSILLDSTWLRWMEPIWHVLAGRNGDEHIFSFNYGAYCKEFRETRRRLGAPMPHSTRGRESIELGARVRPKRSRSVGGGQFIAAWCGTRRQDA